jgi:hypothetical protein
VVGYRQAVSGQDLDASPHLAWFGNIHALSTLRARSLNMDRI